MSVSSVFLYDSEKWSLEDILKYIESLELKAEKSNRMAYHLDDVPKDWPIVGYLIKGYDISFLFPGEHPQFGLVGQVNCTNSSGAKHSPEANKKLYNKLKRKFGMTRVELDKKDRWFGDAAG